jgi:hypothetical protein
MRLACLSFLAAATAGVGFIQAVPAQTIGNSGFETPSLAAQFQYDPATLLGQPWMFSNQAGIAISSPTAFQTAADVSGQFGFIQVNTFPGASPVGGLIAQSITFSSPGSFSLSYLEAGRIPDGAGAFGDVNYRVTITPVGGGTDVLNVVDSTSSGEPFTTTNYEFGVPVAGQYALSFLALSSASGHADDTTFIDNITIIPEPSIISLLMVAVALFFFSRRSRTATPNTVDY